MDDASLNIILVIFAFSWIFSDKKYGRWFIEHYSGHFCILLNIFWQKIWMLLQSTSQLHSGHFCFLLNICRQKIWTMLHHKHDSGHFCVLLNIYENNMDFASINFIPVIFTFPWIFVDKKYERCFIEHHSGHFCILLNIFWQKIWMLLQSTSFRSFLLFPEYF